MHEDEIDPERLFGDLRKTVYLLAQKVGGHGATGQHPEPAAIGNGRYQIMLGQPCHGAAQNGVFTAEKFLAAMPQAIQPCSGFGDSHDLRLRLDRRPYAEHATPVR